MRVKLNSFIKLWVYLNRQAAEMLLDWSGQEIWAFLCVFVFSGRTQPLSGDTACSTNPPSALVLCQCVKSDVIILYMTYSVFTLVYQFGAQCGSSTETYGAYPLLVPPLLGSAQVPCNGKTPLV